MLTTAQKATLNRLYNTAVKLKEKYDKYKSPYLYEKWRKATRSYNKKLAQFDQEPNQLTLL